MKSPPIKSSFKTGHTDTVLSLSSNNNTFASGGDDSNVFLWSLNQPKPTQNINFTNPISVVKLSSFDENILYVAHDNYLAIFDLRMITSCLNEHEIAKEEINDLDISNDGKFLSLCDDSGFIYIFDLTKLNTHRIMMKHENICSSAKFRLNRPREILSGGLDSTLCVSEWRYSNKTKSIFKMNDLVDLDLASIEDPEDSLLKSNRFVQANIGKAGLPINPPMIYDLSMSNEPHMVALALASGCIQIFDSSQSYLKYSATLFGHESSVAKTHFVEKDILLSGGNDNRILIYANLRSKLNLDDKCFVEDPCNSYTQGSKINSIVGESLANILIADMSNEIFLCDFS